MKLTTITAALFAAAITLSSCGASKQTAADGVIVGGVKETKKQQVAAKRWKKYSIPEIKFEDKAPQSEGSKIYHALIPTPNAYIKRWHVRCSTLSIIRRRTAYHAWIVCTTPSKMLTAYLQKAAETAT